MLKARPVYNLSRLALATLSQKKKKISLDYLSPHKLVKGTPQPRARTQESDKSDCVLGFLWTGWNS